MFIYVKSIRCIIADILYITGGQDLKDIVDMDVCRNLKWDRSKDRIKSKVLRLNHLLLTKKEFRNVFYFRMKHHKNMIALCRLVLPDAKAIEFGGEIGGGLMVSHYHSVICPKKAGKNFRVGSGVVIDKEGGFPTFGDNVYVASNSTVTGNINVGDKVIIGAGSVVTEDLPSNGVYVGNPARLIKHIDDNEALLNEIM